MLDSHLQVVPTSLEFGVMACGFPSSQALTLTNTSSVDMPFAWSVPADSQDRPEFKVGSGS